MQHEEGEAEHPESVFRPQLTVAGDVHVEPLGESPHHAGRELTGIGIDIGEVVPGVRQAATRVEHQPAAWP